ncbi:acyl dehydratase [Micrococcus sp. M4NT]|uniref:MaoC/PaaZ C-terminal domain-containing protein n=1 Tax=Micrococcus sp. M4NT TaxID=2957501 RepID=UPI0029BC42C6|nr:MaoC/PaaZ C-terminal domain-containing protein [Micrococcus sp. M4NT]MDX2340187.1 acyl dehydratase [Micrococcus sp. M4NT]
MSAQHIGPQNAPRLSDLAKGDVIGSRTVALTRADLVAYAGASGDHNPIHWSESFATGVGLPGVIAHGMLTMGAAVQLVTDWAGDPGAVVDYQTRFTGMVPVADTTGRADDDGAPLAGARLEVTGTVGVVDEAAGTVRIDLTVNDPALDKPRVLTKAQVLVRLAEPAAPTSKETA